MMFKKVEANKNQSTDHQVNKIRKIDESIKNIDKSYFEYNHSFKQQTLKNITIWQKIV
jgi:hypothetical protein